MRLKISGIGKIGNSEIEMNGITVIAGENDTGKSTFGKVLYCMFNAFYDVNAKILNVQVQHLHSIINNTTQRNIPVVDNLFEDREIIKMIEEAKKNVEGFPEDNVRKIIMAAQPKSPAIRTEVYGRIWVDSVVNGLKQCLAISDTEVHKAIISHYLKLEFEQKINHVNKPNSTGDISLIIRGKNINVSIKNNTCCDFDSGIDINHKAIYIDTPFVMDDIEDIRTKVSFPMFSATVSNPPVKHRLYLSFLLGQKYSNNSIIEEVITNRKITNGMSNLFSIADGEFVEDINGLMFRKNDLKEPIPLPDVSAGIKTFLIIKRLLELGIIKERDVLIFDEPEIHLHPSLQLKFAEVLVLLQKEFNVTILLATHSPYFIYAVDVYGKKHGIKELVKFYLAESSEDTSDVRDVTDSIDSIYKQLAAPFQKLDDMAYGD